MQLASINFFFSPSFQFVMQKETKHFIARELDNESMIVRETTKDEVEGVRRVRKQRARAKTNLHAWDSIVVKNSSNSKGKTIFIFFPRTKGYFYCQNIFNIINFETYLCKPSVKWELGRCFILVFSIIIYIV